MPRVEVTLPDRVDVQLESLVEQQDEFVSREEATEELLEMGLRAYQPDTESQSSGGIGANQRRGPEEIGEEPGEYGGRGEGPGEGGP